MTNEATSSQLQCGEQINILLEEYRSLNALLLFRMTALDRRLPISSGVFAATVATISALPNQSRVAFLLAAPLAVFWLVRTTVHHARAKEDHLRRIDEIERLVNRIAGRELLVFQSRHPSRARTPAGRSGQSTVLATAGSGFVMLAICSYLFYSCATGTGMLLYLLYVTVLAIDVVSRPISLCKYQYKKAFPQLQAT